MNEIVKELLDKYPNILTKEQVDAEILRTIHKLEDKYLILNKTNKATNFIKNLNEVLGYNIKIKVEKAQVGITLYELLFKAIAFSKDDILSYVSDNCYVIPKNEELIDYIQSIDIMYKLSDELNPNPTGDTIKSYPEHVIKRSNKVFNGIIQRLKNDVFNDKILINQPDNTSYEFKKGYMKLNMKHYIYNDEDVMQQVDRQLEELTTLFFGEPYKIEVISSIVNKKLIDKFGIKTAFRVARTSSSIIRKKQKTQKGKLYANHIIEASLFIHYDQYSNLIVKGSFQ